MLAREGDVDRDPGLGVEWGGWHWSCEGGGDRFSLLLPSN